MIFNITYDPSVTAAQQTAVDAVANFFERHYTDAVTVNITVNFADLSAGNGLGRSTTFLNTYSYNNIRTDLAADQISADDAAGALAAIDPITGTHTYWMARAEAKAIDLLGASTAADGNVTFHDGSGGYGFDFNRTDGITAGQYDFFGTVAHEFTEVMGRALLVGGTIGTTTNSYYLYDLYHYSAADTR